jgi:hypothetical protein
MRASVAALAAVLLCVCSFWIAEEAVDGRGLQLSAAWLLLAAVASWQRLQISENSIGWSTDIRDLAVLLLLTGHLVSTLHLEQIRGDLRSAWNLTMEWVGLAAAWYVLRMICCTPVGRSLLIETLVAVIVGQAALGVWQHHVAFPRNADWYSARRQILDEALHNRSGAVLQQARQVTAEFSQLGIPLEGPSRVLWENRALHSTEPLGTFALANTLAGILAVGLILAVARWRAAGTGLSAKFAFAISVALISYCLVLTKSRSAWLGAASGLLLLALQHQSGRNFRLLLRGGLAAAIVIVSAAGVAGITGALDREVILESPKSLQYRLLYWSGTVEMLAENPLFGTGPGNFRQAYLPHKPDESSEEIRDPHNMLLEAWASAGILGLCGMLLLLMSLTTRLWNSSTAPAAVIPEGAEYTDGSPAKSARARFQSGPRLAFLLVCAFVLDAAWEWFSADSLEGKNDDLLLLTGAAAALIRRRLPEKGSVSAASAGLAAAAAASVNLFASGGFGIPTVMLILLACMALTDGIDAHHGKTTKSWPWSPPPWLRFSTAILLISGFVSAAAWVSFSGIRPLFLADRALDLAAARATRQLLPAGRELSTIRDAFRSAIAADPLRVSSRQAWAEFETNRLNSLSATAPLNVNELLAGIDAAFQSWIEADPRSGGPFRLRAAAERRIWELTNDPAVLRWAVLSLSSAVSRHPGEVEVWLEKAELEAASGDQAAASNSAARAAQLNRINHKWGHQDQYLASEKESLLFRLLSSSASSSQHNSQEIPDSPSKAEQNLP